MAYLQQMTDSAEQMAEDQERERAREIIEALPMPPEITGFQIKSGNDSTGDPALWLTFHVRSDVDLSKEELPRLMRFTYEVQSRLTNSGITRMPYALLDQPE